jgi:hypothetical protein
VAAAVLDQLGVPVPAPHSGQQPPVPLTAVPHPQLASGVAAHEAGS